METDLTAVRIVWDEDINPDLSYLESKIVNGKVIGSYNYTQSEYDKDPVQVTKWVEQDHQRLRGYGDTWTTRGCRAEATIKLTVNPKYETIDTIQSGGLWGIESDSTPEYHKEVEAEELECLRLALENRGIDTSKFNHLVTQSEEE